MVLNHQIQYVDSISRINMIEVFFLFSFFSFIWYSGVIKMENLLWLWRVWIPIWLILQKPWLSWVPILMLTVLVSLKNRTCVYLYPGSLCIKLDITYFVYDITLKTFKHWILVGRHAGTPLHHAVKNGLGRTVDLLLSHGGVFCLVTY